MTHAASTASDRVSAQSANRGEAAIAAMSLTFTTIALYPMSRAEAVDLEKCEPSTSASVVRTSSPEPGATTAASSPTPTMTPGPAPDRTRWIAASSSCSETSMALSVPYSRIGDG